MTHCGNAATKNRMDTAFLSSFFPVGRDELAAAADIYQKSKRKRKIARVAAAAAAAAVSC